jgi:hypothetical protein
MNLKKSKSQIPSDFSKAGYLDHFTHRVKLLTISGKLPVANLNKEIATAAKLALNCLKITQNPKIPDFSNLSMINSQEEDFSDNESLQELDLMLAKPMKKRDLNSFAKIGAKYGVKVPISLAKSPKRSVRTSKFKSYTIKNFKKY